MKHSGGSGGVRVGMRDKRLIPSFILTVAGQILKSHLHPGSPSLSLSLSLPALQALPQPLPWPQDSAQALGGALYIATQAIKGFIANNCVSINLCSRPIISGRVGSGEDPGNRNINFPYPPPLYDSHLTIYEP